MTQNKIKKVTKNQLGTGMIKTLFVLTLFAVALCFSKEISAAAVAGIRLSALSVIPSIFPFIILGDVLKSMSPTSSCKSVSKFFEASFGISATGIAAFICGNICGFPIGVGYASNLYTDDLISKDECEHLIGLSNNPSAAFVISGVGVGLCGNFQIGIILYISLIIATLLTGVIFKCRLKTQKVYENTRQRFDLATSIKNAAYSSISICAYIVFFSSLLSLVGLIIKNEIVISITASLLEIGNAVNRVSKLVFLPEYIKNGLLGFCLGFSGFSVHMQARNILHHDISMRIYYIMKATEGILSFIISAALSALYYSI